MSYDVSARAGIVVTGTEVLTGRVADRNGPWIADRLLELGVELAHITICGDRPDDIEAQLRFLADEGVDLIITSGGLGPTADDMTVATSRGSAAENCCSTTALRSRSPTSSSGLMARFPEVDLEAVRAANRKQALVPGRRAGARPGRVPHRESWSPGKPTVVVLPGPPRELQPMWPVAVADTGGAGPRSPAAPTFRQETVRMFGLPESGLADTLRDAEGSVAGFERLEITTCLRRGEIEIVTRYRARRRVGLRRPADAAARAPRRRDLLRGRLDSSTTRSRRCCRPADRDRRILHRGLGGGPADRTARFVGVRRRREWCPTRTRPRSELLGVDAALIDAHGAVSEPVAEAMAAGALRRFGADTAVAITGNRRTGRRDRRKAGGHGVLRVAAGRQPGDRR